MAKCWLPEVIKYQVLGNLPSPHVSRISNKRDTGRAIVGTSL